MRDSLGVGGPPPKEPLGLPTRQAEATGADDCQRGECSTRILHGQLSVQVKHALGHLGTSGRAEVRRPFHAATGTVTATFDQGRGKATLNVIYNGKMPDTVFTFPTQAVLLASYTLVSGMISYDTTPWSTVYLRAENVFDRRYEEVFSYRSPGAGVFAGLKVKSFYDDPIAPIVRKN